MIHVFSEVRRYSIPDAPPPRTPQHCCVALSQEMIDEADRDGDGEINEEEFLRIMKKTALY